MGPSWRSTGHNVVRENNLNRNGPNGGPGPGPFKIDSELLTEKKLMTLSNSMSGISTVNSKRVVA